MECDTTKMPQTLETAGLAAFSKGENVTFRVTKPRILGWREAKVQHSALILAQFAVKQQKSLAFPQDEAAIPKDLPFFHEMKKCWNQV